MLSSFHSYRELKNNVLYTTVVALRKKVAFMDILSFLIKVAVYGLPTILAITLHEAAHGFVALRCGDPTALYAGRLTLNPLRHIDPVGTILLPGLLLLSHAPFLFGYAKPVPVNFDRLRSPRKDTVLVAFAGPATNLALALVSALLFHTLMFVPDLWVPWYGEMLGASLILNVALALFNMIPLLPLDGGRVLMALLPPRLARVFAPLEKWGMGILIALIIILPLILFQFKIKFNVIAWLLGPAVSWTVHGIAQFAGINP